VFFLRRPTEAQVAAFLAAQQWRPLSYQEVGATRTGRAPRRYFFDHTRQHLGTGAVAFERALEALRSWELLRLGWVEPCAPLPPLRTGATLGMCIRHYGFYSLVADRIVYTVDEAGPVRRYGFAYGTIAGHPERGEERFLLEWERAGDDGVWLDILAFSRPARPLAIAGLPLTRRLQKRFGPAVAQALRRAITAGGTVGQEDSV
jgi:uncharacterized protein (UPF0548 family)